MKERINWIDNAKGFAMILVILGHIATPNWLHGFIYSFHVPLFFILSGFFLSADNKTVKVFLAKKAKTLLLPLVGYSLLMIGVYYIWYDLILNKETLKDTINRLIGIIWQSSGGDYKSCFWFLSCLFVGQILLFFLLKTKINRIVLLVLLLFLGEMENILCIKYQIYGKLPWSVDNIFLAAAMLLLGNILKDLIATKKIKEYWTVLTGIFFVSLFLLNYYLKGYKLSLFGTQGIHIIMILEAILGSLLVILIARKTNNIRILGFIGKNSLFYYVMQFMVFIIPNIVFYNILKINVETISDGPLLLVDAVYLILTVVIISILCIFKNRVKNRFSIIKEEQTAKE